MSETVSQTAEPRAGRPVIGVVSTAPALCAEVDRRATEEGLTARLVHLVDEGMLWQAMAEGTSPGLVKRLALHCELAVASGAQAVLVTCSSLGTATEQLRSGSSVPLLRIDEPMARQALAYGNRVGVCATLASTLAPTEELVRRLAAEAGQPLELKTSLCPGAFEAWRAGAAAEHDAAVLAALAGLAGQVHVVVLAQASMRRVLDNPAARDLGLPVLSSPASGVHQLAELGFLPSKLAGGRS